LAQAQQQVSQTLQQAIQATPSLVQAQQRLAHAQRQLAPSASGGTANQPDPMEEPAGQAAHAALLALQAAQPAPAAGGGGRGGMGGGGRGGQPFDVPYTEKLEVGYKWYDAENKDPLFPFGFGLSHTTYHIPT
jgi:hypothetical protein